MRAIDHTGKVYGRLTVIERQGTLHGQSAWKVQCSCGVQKLIRAYDLRWRTRSCGCLSVDKVAERNTKHGLTESPEHRSWNSMLDRCSNEKNPQYHNYGGRGIKVCERWRDFMSFYSDLGPRPDGMSLERIDNSQGYSKENCRWATAKQQRDNQRNSKLVELDGEIMCLHDWARKVGMNYMVLKSRLSRGMTLREAISKPVAPQDKERGLKAAQTRWAMQKGASND